MMRQFWVFTRMDGSRLLCVVGRENFDLFWGFSTPLKELDDAS